MHLLHPAHQIQAHTKADIAEQLNRVEQVEQCIDSNLESGRYISRVGWATTYGSIGSGGVQRLCYDAVVTFI